MNSLNSLNGVIDLFNRKVVAYTLSHKAYLKYLEEFNLEDSMSWKVNPYNNACAESFFTTESIYIQSLPICHRKNIIIIIK